MTMTDSSSQKGHQHSKDGEPSMQDFKTDSPRDDHDDRRLSGFAFLSNLFVIFGNSGFGLVASFLLLAISVGVSMWVDIESPAMGINILQNLMSSAKAPIIYTLNPDQDIIVTAAMRAAFEKDGVIAMRGLLDEAMLSELVLASENIMEQSQLAKPKPKRTTHGRRQKGRQFHTVENGIALREAPIFTKGENRTAILPPFLRVSIESKVPSVIASLLNLNEGSGDNLRMFRDIFLAKDEEQYICGWHVDDFGFWPADSDSPGINAWIALDDMPLTMGGGFALSVGSHVAPWREEAYRVTGATPALPKEGFASAADLFANRTGEGTCNIKSSAPHLHQKMEDSSRIYSLQRGDIIFHDRWLFHRTVPFKKNSADKTTEEGKQSGDKLYKRYSIRYNPGSSRIPLGYGLEPSVMFDETVGGKTADDVVTSNGPWYPKAWPTISEQEMEALSSLIETKMPVAQERLKQRRREMEPFLRSM